VIEDQGRSQDRDREQAPAEEMRRLRWRSRRGLLENDLLLRRFLDRQGDRLERGCARALAELLALPDGELLDLLLGRGEPGEALDTTAVRNLLFQIRST
jgi:antitoxin CptB